MKSPWESLSVFFPVHNEAAALPGVIEGALKVLEGLGLEDYEVIIVDDGSTDGTAAMADRYPHGNAKVRVLHHARNEGYGAALSTGLRAARYKWVVYTDGDGQFDFADIGKFAEASQRADVVLGYRRTRRDHLGRRFNAWVWILLVRLMLGLKVRDLDCGFKLFRTEKIRELGELEARGAVISAELLMKLRAHGATWEEVAVEHYARQGGEASGARLPVIGRAIAEVWRLRRAGR